MTCESENSATYYLAGEISAISLEIDSYGSFIKYMITNFINNGVDFDEERIRSDLEKVRQMLNETSDLMFDIKSELREISLTNANDTDD